MLQASVKRSLFLSKHESACTLQPLGMPDLTPQRILIGEICRYRVATEHHHPYLKPPDQWRTQLEKNIISRSPDNNPRTSIFDSLSSIFVALAVLPRRYSPAEAWNRTGPFNPLLIHRRHHCRLLAWLSILYITLCNFVSSSLASKFLLQQINIPTPRVHKYLVFHINEVRTDDSTLI